MTVAAARARVSDREVRRVERVVRALGVRAGREDPRSVRSERPERRGQDRARGSFVFWSITAAYVAIRASAVGVDTTRKASFVPSGPPRLVMHGPDLPHLERLQVGRAAPDRDAGTSCRA